MDTMIAAIADEHGMAVATLNVPDFEDCGIEVINPWEHAASYIADRASLDVTPLEIGATTMADLGSHAGLARAG